MVHQPARVKPLVIKGCRCICPAFARQQSSVFNETGGNAHEFRIELIQQSPGRLWARGTTPTVTICPGGDTGGGCRGSCFISPGRICGWNSVPATRPPAAGRHLFQWTARRCLGLPERLQYSSFRPRTTTDMKAAGRVRRTGTRTGLKKDSPGISDGRWWLCDE